MAARSGERILVVDGDPEARLRLSAALREVGLEADAVGSGRAALALAGKIRPAVVVLEAELPDGSGLEVCRRLRADAALGDCGVLFVSTRDAEPERLAGFAAGGDGYASKSCSTREIVHRVRVLARRVAARRAARADAPVPSILRWRALELDPAARAATLDGAPLPLSPRELALLAALLAAPGRVHSREALLAAAWPGVAAGARTVDSHVRRLRARLGPYGEAIETVQGFGYRLKDAEGDPIVTAS